MGYETKFSIKKHAEKFTQIPQQLEEVIHFNVKLDYHVACATDRNVHTVF